MAVQMPEAMSEEFDPGTESTDSDGSGSILADQPGVPPDRKRTIKKRYIALATLWIVVIALQLWILF